MLFITGSNSKIVQELNIEPKFVLTREMCNLEDITAIDSYKDVILNCDKFILAHGHLDSKTYLDMTSEEITRSMNINLLSTIRIIELALLNPKARIVVLGSESGLKGSYDTTYGLAKMALHKYVEERKIKYPDQQLVCIAPSLITDSNMTAKRKDKDNVDKAIANNPKKRGLLAKEIANLIKYLLYQDEGYITNAVIHMNGGKYARCA